jgi:hypothetical protein
MLLRRASAVALLAGGLDTLDQPLVITTPMKRAFSPPSGGGGGARSGGGGALAMDLSSAGVAPADRRLSIGSMPVSPISGRRLCTAVFLRRGLSNRAWIVYFVSFSQLVHCVIARQTLCVVARRDGAFRRHSPRTVLLHAGTDGAVAQTLTTRHNACTVLLHAELCLTGPRDGAGHPGAVHMSLSDFAAGSPVAASPPAGRRLPGPPPPHRGPGAAGAGAVSGAGGSRSVQPPPPPAGVTAAAAAFV